MEQRPLKIAQGNDAYVAVPLYVRTWSGSTPCDTHITASDLTNIKGYIDGVQGITGESGAGDVTVKIPASTPIGTYAIAVTAKYNGNNVARRYFQAVQIVEYSDDEDVLTGEGSPYLLPAGIYYNNGGTPTPIDPEELIRQNGVLIDENGELIEQNTTLMSGLAKQGSNADATSTAILAAVNALYGGDTTATLSALKTAIAGITFDKSDLAKANALAAVQLDVDAIEVLIGTTSDTASSATIFGKFTAVLAAIANISIDTSSLAQRSDVKDGNDTAIGMLKDGTNGLAAIKTQAANAASDAAAAKTAAQAISVPTVQQIQNGLAKTSELPTDYAKQGGDATATNTALKTAIAAIPTTAPATPTNVSDAQTAIIAAVQANAGVPAITIPSTTAAQELAPNTLYIFAERTGDLTLTLGTPITGIANDYHLFLAIGSTAPTITWPTGITWQGGSAPTIAANTTYEVDILNNVAVYF